MHLVDSHPPALGPLRDEALPLAREAAAVPRIDATMSQKIRSICFILSVAVVFNHAVTYHHVWDWQGYRTEPIPADYFASAPFEVSIQQFISGALGRITNPVFFAVSGYLFFFAWKPDWPSWKRKLRRRAFTLLIPFVFWGLAGMAVNYVPFVVHNWRVFFDPEVRGPYSRIDILLFFFNMRGPTQLWFLRDLMLIMLIMTPLLVGLVRLRAVVFVPLLAAAYLVSWKLPVIDKNGFCFFTLGAFLGYRQIDLQFRMGSSRMWAIAIWLFLALFYTGLAIRTPWNLQVLFKLVVLAGILGVWALYDLLPNKMKRPLDNISSYRFFVYMGFDPLLPILQAPILGAIPQNQCAHLAVYLALPLVVATVCVALAWLLNQFSPQIYFVITGGRLPSRRPDQKANSSGDSKFQVRR